MKGIIDDEVPYISLYFYKDAVFYNKVLEGTLTLIYGMSIMV